MSPGSGTHVT